MQLAGPVVVGKPRLDKRGAAVGIAGFEIAVGAGMGGKSAAWIAGERALDLGGAARDIAQFDPRPAGYR